MEVILLVTKKYDDIIEQAKSLSETSFPKIIEIQTMSFCNGGCIVCPYRSLNIEKKRMSDKVLNKLLTEIENHKNEVERVIPYLNNEPSFDTRMMKILRRLKKDNIFVEVSTNISNWKIKELESIVKEKLIGDFRISFFGHNKKLYEELMTGLNFSETSEKVKYLLDINRKENDKIDIEIIVVLLPNLDINEIKAGLNELFDYPKIHFFGFLDRCGKVEIAKNKLITNIDAKVVGCKLNRPYERCCIYANGNVVICSQDWDQEVILGNINENTIEEIWNGKKAKMIRKIVLGERKCPTNFLCKRCKLAILKSNGEKKLNFCGDRYMSRNDNKLLK